MKIQQTTPEILQICYALYFGHAQPQQPTEIVCIKSTLSPVSQLPRAS